MLTGVQTLMNREGTVWLEEWLRGEGEGELEGLAHEVEGKKRLRIKVTKSEKNNEERGRGINNCL